jgi:hypothetical protein
LGEGGGDGGDDGVPVGVQPDEAALDGVDGGDYDRGLDDIDHGKGEDEDVGVL